MSNVMNGYFFHPNRSLIAVTGANSIKIGHLLPLPWPISLKCEENAL